MKRAVPVVVLMTTICYVMADTNKIISNRTEAETHTTESVQTTESMHNTQSVINTTEEEQNVTLYNKTDTNYTSAQEIAKRNLYTLVKIRLLGHLLQKLPVEKRQSIFIDALKQVSAKKHVKNTEKGIAQAFSMHHRKFENSNEMGSGSQASSDEDGGNSQEKESVSIRNREDFDDQTKLQLEVLNNQVSNDVKHLLNTVFPGVESNPSHQTSSPFVSTAPPQNSLVIQHQQSPNSPNHLQQSALSGFASKQLDSQHSTPVQHSYFNVVQTQPRQPVHASNILVSHPSFPEGQAYENMKITEQQFHGTGKMPISTPPTMPLVVYHNPSFLVEPSQETLNLEPVIYNDYSGEIPSPVTFMDEDKDLKNRTATMKGNNYGAKTESYYNGHVMQSTNNPFTDNDSSKSSEENSNDNAHFNANFNSQNLNIYPSNDVQDYYENHLLNSHDTNVEDAVQMIFNLFNDIDNDDYVDYENEELNFDVVLRPTTTQSPLLTTQGYADKTIFNVFSPLPDVDENKGNKPISSSNANSKSSESFDHSNPSSVEQHSKDTHERKTEKIKSVNLLSREMKDTSIGYKDIRPSPPKNYIGKDITENYTVKHLGITASQDANREEKTSNDASNWSLISILKTDSSQSKNEIAKNFDLSSSDEIETLNTKPNNLFPLVKPRGNIKSFKKYKSSDQQHFNSKQNSDSKLTDDFNEEDLTLFNLLDKPVTYQFKNEEKKSYSSSYSEERKFGFDSEEEHGRDGRDSSNENSNEKTLFISHFPDKPQLSNGFYQVENRQNVDFILIKSKTSRHSTVHTSRENAKQLSQNNSDSTEDSGEKYFRSSTQGMNIKNNSKSLISKGKESIAYDTKRSQSEDVHNTRNKNHDSDESTESSQTKQKEYETSKDYFGRKVNENSGLAEASNTKEYASYEKKRDSSQSLFSYQFELSDSSSEDGSILKKNFEKNNRFLSKNIESNAFSNDASISCENGDCNAETIIKETSSMGDDAKSKEHIQFFNSLDDRKYSRMDTSHQTSDADEENQSSMERTNQGNKHVIYYYDSESTSIGSLSEQNDGTQMHLKSKSVEKSIRESSIDKDSSEKPPKNQFIKDESFLENRSVSQDIEKYVSKNYQNQTSSEESVVSCKGNHCNPNVHSSVSSVTEKKDSANKETSLSSDSKDSNGEHLDLVFKSYTNDNKEGSSIQSQKDHSDSSREDRHYKSDQSNESATKDSSSEQNAIEIGAQSYSTEKNNQIFQGTSSESTIDPSTSQSNDLPDVESSSLEKENFSKNKDDDTSFSKDFENYQSSEVNSCNNCNSEVHSQSSESGTDSSLKTIPIDEDSFSLSKEDNLQSCKDGQCQNNEYKSQSSSFEEEPINSKENSKSSGEKSLENVYSQSKENLSQIKSSPSEQASGSSKDDSFEEYKNQNSSEHVIMKVKTSSSESNEDLSMKTHLSGNNNDDKSSESTETEYKEDVSYGSELIEKHESGQIRYENSHYETENSNESNSQEKSDIPSPSSFEEEPINSKENSKSSGEKLQENVYSQSKENLSQIKSLPSEQSSSSSKDDSFEEYKNQNSSEHVVMKVETSSSESNEDLSMKTHLSGNNNDDKSSESTETEYQEGVSYGSEYIEKYESGQIKYENSHYETENSNESNSQEKSDIPSPSSFEEEPINSKENSKSSGEKSLENVYSQSKENLSQIKSSPSEQASGSSKDDSFEEYKNQNSSEHVIMKVKTSFSESNEDLSMKTHLSGNNNDDKSSESTETEYKEDVSYGSELIEKHESGQIRYENSHYETENSNESNSQEKSDIPSPSSFEEEPINSKENSKSSGEKLQENVYSQSKENLSQIKSLPSEQSSSSSKDDSFEEYKNQNSSEHVVMKVETSSSESNEDLSMKTHLSGNNNDDKSSESTETEYQEGVSYGSEYIEKYESGQIKYENSHYETENSNESNSQEKSDIPSPSSFEEEPINSKENSKSSGEKSLENVYSQSKENLSQIKSLPSKQASSSSKDDSFEEYENQNSSEHVVMKMETSSSESNEDLSMKTHLSGNNNDDKSSESTETEYKEDVSYGSELIEKHESGQIRYENSHYETENSNESNSQEKSDIPSPSGDEKSRETKIQFFIEKVSGNGGDDQESDEVDSKSVEDINYDTSEQVSEEITKIVDDQLRNESPQDPNTPSSTEQIEIMKEIQNSKEKSDDKEISSGSTEENENQEENEKFIEKIENQEEKPKSRKENEHQEEKPSSKEKNEHQEEKPSSSEKNENKEEKPNSSELIENKDYSPNDDAEVVSEETYKKENDTNEIIYYDDKTKEKYEKKDSSEDKLKNEEKKEDVNETVVDNVEDLFSTEDKEKDTEDPPVENSKMYEENVNKYDSNEHEKQDCKDKTNENNENRDNTMDEIRNDDDLENAVHMISDMFVFDFGKSSNSEQTNYEPQNNKNSPNDYGKVGRVKMLIKKLVHLKNLWHRSKTGSTHTKSSSVSQYGRRHDSKLQMILPTLKNNLYETSSRRSSYGHKVHTDYGSYPTYGPRQKLPYFIGRTRSPYGSRLSRYLRGGVQNTYKNPRYGRTGYGSKRLKISFGGNSNEYAEPRVRSAPLSGLLTRGSRNGGHGLRNVYSDSYLSDNINDPYFFSPLHYTDDDIIVHPVVTKSTY